MALEYLCPLLVIADRERWEETRGGREIICVRRHGSVKNPSRSFLALHETRDE